MPPEEEPRRLAPAPPAPGPRPSRPGPLGLGLPLPGALPPFVSRPESVPRPPAGEVQCAASGAAT